MHENREDFYWLNDESKLFLSRGYIDSGITAKQRYRQISDNAERILNIPGFSDKFYHYLAKGYYSLSTPVVVNFGNEKGLPISCYGSYLNDDLGNIFDTIKEVAVMNKLGGGTSGYFGKLRSRGTPISTGGDSNGSFSFLQIFDTTVSVVNQGNARRGMFAGYIDIDHADIEEWVNIQTEGNPVQDIYWGVNVTNKFLDKVKKGDKQARNLWAKILDTKNKTGVPYLHFIDNVNDNKADIYIDKNIPIYASNLCVSGDTRILTKEYGYVEIGTKVGEKVTVWNGQEWSENVELVKTGENQKLYRVKLSNGRFIDATAYHKWYVQANDTNSEDQVYKLQTSELKEGMKLESFKLPLIEGNLVLDDAYNVSKLQKDFVPNSQYTVKSRLEWLAGYFDNTAITRQPTDGQFIIINDNDLDGYDLDFIINVQDMLQSLGVESKISEFSGFERYRGEDENGKNVFESTIHQTLTIDCKGIKLLHDLGLTLKRLELKTDCPEQNEVEFITIISIEEINGLYDTYCCHEPKRNKVMFNGVMTGNCVEISLPSNLDWSFVCCLMSLNLEHYEEWKETDAVETAIYFLDSVMTEFIDKAKKYEGMEKAVKFAEENRALGLGVLGWHTYLQKHMIPFDGFRAMQKNNEIFKLIRERSYAASEEMGKLYGYPAIMEGFHSPRRHATTMAIAPTKSSSYILGQVSQGIEPYKTNYFIKDVAKTKSVFKNPQLVKLLEEKGKNTDEVWTDILKHGGSVQYLDFLTQEEKDIFKTFEEISQLTVIQQAAQRQKYIDQSQSVNVTIHPDTPLKDINALYLQAAELGVKGIYYQFSSSAAQTFNRELLTCSSCEG